MKKKQKAEPESRRKSSYKGNSRNNSKSGGLTFSEKKRLIQLKHILSGKSNEKEKPTTAQKTITFEKMFRDGICQVSHRYYTKMVEFFDINYELLEVDDQADILAQYSKLINYFDPSVKFELVLFNRQVNEQMLTEQFDIPWQEDDFNDIREEYTEMLKKQAAKGNNGIIKSKYLIFGVESNGYKEAKSRLNNIEKDVIRNLNNIHSGEQLRQVLTVPDLYAGYFQTAAYITCQEPQHKAFMTSVLRYQRQTQRQETLSFLPEPIMQDVRLHMSVSIVVTVRWCIVAIQSSTPQSIPLTGRAIFMVLED